MNTPKLLEMFFRRFAQLQAVLFLQLMAALVAFSACNRDTLLGLEAQPEGSLDLVQKADTFTVHAITLPGEPQRSDEALYTYLGMINDPVFGKTAAHISLSLGFNPAGLLANKSSYRVDSAVLKLQPRTVYGNPEDPVDIEVFELSQRVYSDSSYFHNFNPRTEDDLVAQKSIVANNTLMKNDTTPVAFRLHLDKEFAEHLFYGLGDLYTDSETFRQFVNGFFIKATGNTALGAIYGFSLTSGASSLTLYLSRTDTSALVTHQVNYPVTSASARINSFDHDYSGSTVEASINEQNPLSDRFYVEGLGGCKGEIRFPSLEKFGKTSPWAIHKAELILSVSDQQPSGYTYADKLYLLDINTDGTEALTPDFVYSELRHGGTVNDENRTYTFDITRHIQHALRASWEGKAFDSRLRVHAQVPVLNGTEMSRTILNGSDNIVLKIYYTDISD
ncbi:MAG: hypothetical protein Kow0075_12440 [Salibacteraceae bacterium]